MEPGTAIKVGKRGRPKGSRTRYVTARSPIDTATPAEMGQYAVRAVFNRWRFWFAKNDERRADKYYAQLMEGIRCTGRYFNPSLSAVDSTVGGNVSLNVVRVPDVSPDAASWEGEVLKMVTENPVPLPRRVIDHRCDGMEGALPILPSDGTPISDDPRGVQSLYGDTPPLSSSSPDATDIR